MVARRVWIWPLAVAGCSLGGVAATAQPATQEPAQDTLFFVRSERLPAFAGRIGVLGSGGAVAGPVVEGKPYSARSITESMQTLADGNRITQRNESVFYRDSQGRTRSEQTLQDLADGIRGAGGQAELVAGDIAERETATRIARTAVEHFGRIDSWVNDAGVSIFGRLTEVADEDSRRLFDTNFWGVVYGSLAAPIAVLLWLYLLALSVLIGAAVNAAFDTVFPQQSTTRARRELVQRLRERMSVRDS